MGGDANDDTAGSRQAGREIPGPTSQMPLGAFQKVWMVLGYERLNFLIIIAIASVQCFPVYSACLLTFDLY